MIKVANTLLILGILVFIATLALFLYHFDQTGFPLISDTIGMTASGAFSCFAIFMRRRVIQGIPILEMTPKDKAQLQEVRREFGLRNILAGLLVRFGGLILIAGILSPIYRGFDWPLITELIGIGIILLVAGISLERRIRRKL